MKNPVDYKYKDQHFSQEIAEALLAEIWTSRLSIPSIRKKLLDLHLIKSGEHPNIFDLPDPEADSIVQEALEKLSKKAMTSYIHRDIWRIAKPDQWIFGTGKHWVYLYYTPQDKQDAASKGKSIWSCRIGKTDGVDENGQIKYDAPETRVKNQTLSYRQKPITALLIRADKHTALETAIHRILTLREQDDPNAQGNSWFFTNPREVVEIVANINLDLLSPVIMLPPVLNAIYQRRRNNNEK